MMIKRILALSAACALVLCQLALGAAAQDFKGAAAQDQSAQIVLAGVGNQNSYSGGGGSGGYSGSSGGYSGGYRSGGSSFVFLGGLGGGGGNIWVVLAIAVIVIILINIAKNKSRGGSSGGGVVPQRAAEQRPAVSPAGEIVRTDPAFSEERFLAWAREVFITLNDAWEKRDWSLIRPFESEALFREHNQQLQEYIDNGTVNVLDRVAVKDSWLSRYDTDNEFEYLEVKMRTSMIDYVKEIETGKITAGDATTLWQMMHTLTFMRTKGVKTKESAEELHVTNCPNCGAPTEITSAGECPYCHSVITTGEYSWVLCRFVGENL